MSWWMLVAGVILIGGSAISLYFGRRCRHEWVRHETQWGGYSVCLRCNRVRQ